MVLAVWGWVVGTRGSLSSMVGWGGSYTTDRGMPLPRPLQANTVTAQLSCQLLERKCENECDLTLWACHYYNGFGISCNRSQESGVVEGTGIERQGLCGV